MSAVPLGGAARPVYLTFVRNAVIKLIAGTARHMRVAAMRALPLVLILCVASPLLTEAGYGDHGQPIPTQQVVLAAADAEVPHECGCLECPQHAWDRERDVQAAVLDRRVAASRVTYALADDESRPSLVGDITEPPRA